MNTDYTKENKSFYLLYFVSLGIFFLGRIIGTYLFENNWAFTHWQNTPWYYFIIIAVACIGLGYFIYQKSELLDKINSPLKLSLTGAVLLAIFIFSQTDSFLYSGGNYIMADLARVTAVVYNWYDFGLTFLSKTLYNLFLSLGNETNPAAYYSWKTISFAGTIISMILAYHISRILVVERRSRVLLFIALFFGAHSIVYFGLIGFQTFLLAFIYLFVFFFIRLSQNNNPTDLIYLSLTTVLSVLFHPYLYILIPVFIMGLLLFGLKTNIKISFTIGAISFIGLLLFIYSSAGGNFALAKHILFIEGDNITKGYNLLSLNHIGDIIVLALLFFPHLILFKYLVCKQISVIFNKPLLAGLFLLTITANTAVCLLEPINSIVLDLPTLLIFLSPASILIAVISLEHKLSVGRLKALALIVLIVPISLWPIYNRLDLGSEYFSDYMDKNPRFYIEGCTAIQDSYHYQKNIEKANEWYLVLPKLSSDFMDLTVARENISGGAPHRSISHLTKLKTKYPFMIEPRFLLANVYQQQRKFPQARGEIDTCLMLAPNDVKQLKLDYRFYRDIGDFAKAIKKAQATQMLYPNDVEIKADLAIFYYRSGDYILAEALCDSLIFDNADLPYPQLIKGFILEIKKQPIEAAQHYRRFLDLAPKAGEFETIQNRLDSLMREIEYER